MPVGEGSAAGATHALIVTNGRRGSRTGGRRGDGRFLDAPTQSEERVHSYSRVPTLKGSLQSGSKNESGCRTKMGRICELEKNESIISN